MYMNENMLALIALFKEQHPEFGCPDEADGNCGYATDLFLEMVEMLHPEMYNPMAEGEIHFTSTRRLARQRKYVHPGWGNDDIPTFRYTDAPHHWYRNGCEWSGHVCAHVGEWVIDWTARQFRPDAPFPLAFKYSDIKHK